jgi:crotonobetainyl-CoA:carnitine CoA-transferase CaiB-like acyl-CoA transferase
MGSTVAGPFCGRLLADFGAEVIKVEAPGGDIVRTMGAGSHPKSLYAASIFRNKALISIDLRDERGRGIVRDLAATCDVMIENFKPGRLEEWGLGHERLSVANPGLILVRISGFGQTGPYSGRGGYGVIGEAFSGLRHITGDPDRPPARAATSLTDYISGLYGAFGAVLALLGRGRDGRGQVIDVSLFESAFSFMEPWIPAYDQLGHVAGRMGSRLPGSAPNNLYPTADHEFVHITAVSDALFLSLCRVLGDADLAQDERFSSAESRVAHHEALDDRIAAWTSSLRLSELEESLLAAEIPASRIFTMADIFADPHYQARESIVRVSDPDLGSIALAGVVPRLSETPGVVRHTGRSVGEDTTHVLTSMLGLDQETVHALEEAGVINCGGDAASRSQRTETGGSS